MPRDFQVTSLASATLVGLGLFISGCNPNALQRTDRESAPSPVEDRNAASAAALVQYLELLQKLVQSAPASQAEIFAATQREYELAPTPNHQLRFALVLAAPGHTATDTIRAHRMLREILAIPETLLPMERALAFLELQKVEQQLALSAENKRLLSSNSREDRDKLIALNKRLQTETDENARLRKELDEARAKLDAIANIESSLNQRKSTSEGHPP